MCHRLFGLNNIVKFKKCKLCIISDSAIFEDYITSRDEFSSSKAIYTKQSTLLKGLGYSSHKPAFDLIIEEQSMMEKEISRHTNVGHCYGWIEAINLMNLMIFIFSTLLYSKRSSPKFHQRLHTAQNCN